MRYIAILRGINVSGKNKILMEDLKSLFTSLNFLDVSTYIQSGNVVFTTIGEIDYADLATKIQTEIQKKFGFDVPVIIRNLQEWKMIISNNPFTNKTEVIQEKLHVTFLSDFPLEENIAKIKFLDFSPDQFTIIGKEIYLYIPETYGETKLSNKFFENKLKVSATTRNWNTINKILELGEK